MARNKKKLEVSWLQNPSKSLPPLRMDRLEMLDEEIRVVGFHRFLIRFSHYRAA